MDKVEENSWPRWEQKCNLGNSNDTNLSGSQGTCFGEMTKTEKLDWNHILEKFEYQIDRFSLNLVGTEKALQPLDRGSNVNRNVIWQHYFWQLGGMDCQAKR